MRPESERHSQVGIALRVLAVGIGIFFIAMSAQKTTWLMDSGQLLQRFERWRPEASPGAGWYLDTVAIPGVIVFARLVPLAELAAGLALILGVWPRIAALLALIMVINFHFATSALHSWAFLSDGTGPPLLAGLLALVIAGKDLPFTIPVARSPRLPEQSPLDNPGAYTELS